MSSIEIEVIRGDTFQQSVLLRDGFEELVDDRLSFRGRLAFRIDQDDTLPDLLSVEVVPEIVQDQCNEPPYPSLHFTIAPSQTQALPPYAIVAYCEVRRTDGTVVSRLYNARVEMSD